MHHTCKHKCSVLGWALPALLCALCCFTQAPNILRSGAKWAGVEAPLMYTGSLSVWVRSFTADLSKLLIHHHFCRRGPVLKWVSHKYQWLAVSTRSSITQLSLNSSPGLHKTCLRSKVFCLSALCGTCIKRESATLLWLEVLKKIWYTSCLKKYKNIKYRYQPRWKD